MANQETVTIKFTGSTVIQRIIGDAVWEPANGHLAEVDLDLAADLLTSPEGDWQLVGSPGAATLKRLGALMGAPPELIIVNPVANAEPVEETEDEPAVPAEGVEQNG
jgi:hypothetical protein